MATGRPGAAALIVWLSAIFMAVTPVTWSIYGVLAGRLAAQTR